MSHNRSPTNSVKRVAKKLAVACAFLVAAILILLTLAFVYISIAGRLELNNSINVVATMLDPEYEITQRKFDSNLIDLSGLWSIKTHGDIAAKIATMREFGKADDYDLEYYKSVVTKAFGGDYMLDGYELYRAEFSLGKRTMCAESPCNMYVLVKHGNEFVFIGIYKI